MVGASTPSAFVLGEYFGQSEIENLRMSALGDEDVCGLDVAMDNAGGVCRIQCVGNFDSQRQSRVSVSRGRPAMRCFSVIPSRNSMAMNDCPSCLPIS